MTGLSRVGKSTEIRSLIAEFNRSDERLPSGKPAKIVSCVLDGKITWKDLGYRTPDALGYPMTSGRLTQSAVWSRVTK